MRPVYTPFLLSLLFCSQSIRSQPGTTQSFGTANTFSLGYTVCFHSLLYTLISWPLSLAFTRTDSWSELPSWTFLSLSCFQYISGTIFTRTFFFFYEPRGKTQRNEPHNTTTSMPNKKLKLPPSHQSQRMHIHCSPFIYTQMHTMEALSCINLVTKPPSIFHTLLNINVQRKSIMGYSRACITFNVPAKQGNLNSKYVSYCAGASDHDHCIL